MARKSISQQIAEGANLRTSAQEAELNARLLAKITAPAAKVAAKERMSALLAEVASLARETAAEACTTPDEAFAQVLKAFPQMMSANREHFITLFLNGRRQVIGSHLVSLGTLTATLVHPREVFAPALIAGAASILVAHNHPSGDPTPSNEDRLLTDRLTQGGRLLGVNVDDHLIIGRGVFTSLRQMGIMVA